MNSICPFCGEKLFCRNNLINMKYRWGIIKNYTFSCGHCKRLFKSVNDLNIEFTRNVLYIFISLTISFGFTSLLKNKLFFILFFIICFSVLKQLSFIIRSWLPCNLLEIDLNGIPIEEKKFWVVKIAYFTKNIQKLKKDKLYVIQIEDGIGLIKLIDWKVEKNEVILYIRRYSVSPVIKKGQHITFMQMNSKKNICYGCVINDY